MFIARSFGVGDIRAEGSGQHRSDERSARRGILAGRFSDAFFGRAQRPSRHRAGEIELAGLDHFQPSQELLWSIGLAAVIGHCLRPG